MPTQYQVNLPNTIGLVHLVPLTTISFHVEKSDRSSWGLNFEFILPQNWSHKIQCREANFERKTRDDFAQCVPKSSIK